MVFHMLRGGLDWFMMYRLRHLLMTLLSISPFHCC